MKIILSKTFIDDFDKQFNRYNINHKDLVLKIKQSKLINLKNPYIKIKIQINGVSLRGIGILNDIETFIPLFFVLKKDKRYGENLILNKEVYLKINNLFSIYSKDFISGDIVEFLK